MNMKKTLVDLNSKIKSSSEFVTKLNYENYFFQPALAGVTEAGAKLELGFSCYGLKYYYLSGLWDNLNTTEKQNWIEKINSYQLSDSRFPSNSFVDPNYIYYLNRFNLNKTIKNIIKNIINSSGIKSYDSKNVYEKKSINAETKQAIATLYQIGSKNLKTVEPEFKGAELLNYLNSLDWSLPWASGAQFSSICVYSATQESYDSKLLKEFVDSLVDVESGFYLKGKPTDTRQLFNGAMKIISGLDWINHDIHYPEKIIDFCINNEPIFEGCDIVDYIYILYMCSKETNYKKKEVINKMLDLSKEMQILYSNNLGGYSYFKNKSQTHYYGVRITEGLDTPDIHATLLCTWANIMILKTMDELDEKYKTLKP